MCRVGFVTPLRSGRGAANRPPQRNLGHQGFMLDKNPLAFETHAVKQRLVVVRSLNFGNLGECSVLSSTQFGFNATSAKKKIHLVESISWRMMFGGLAQFLMVV